VATPGSRYCIGHHRRRDRRDPPRICSGCGREGWPRLAELKWLDPNSATYVCDDCRPGTSRIVVFCRRCPKSKRLWPSAVRQRKSIEQDERGYWQLCRECRSRDTLRFGRMAQASELGVLPSDDPDVRRAAMQERMASAVAAAGGRVKLMELANNARKRGLTERGRRRLTLGLMIAAERPGQFRLCLLCHKLIYLAPSRFTQGASGYHGECWNRWRWGAVYREWITKVGSPDGPLASARRRRFPPPTPPRPAYRPPGAPHLDRSFRWLLRHYGLSQSWRDIGGRESIDHKTVSRDVRRLIAILPDSWAKVFGGKRAGKQLDTLLSIADLRRFAQERRG
jgi:hypothetical protein